MNAKIKATTLLKQLIAIQSPTGNENAIGKFLIQRLTRIGFGVEKIPLSDGRFNIFAKIGKPNIILQAHMDVVSPYLPPKEDAKFIYGRGACDTKGSIASMLTAAECALSRGIKNFGLLFTVGEEDDFVGAYATKNLVVKNNAFVVIGEPTKLKPITSHYGFLTLQVICTGVSAHNSNPKKGKNAIDLLTKLLENKIRMNLKIKDGTVFSVAQIHGGSANNVVPDYAWANITLRIAPEDTTNYTKELQKLVGKSGIIKKLDEMKPTSGHIPHNLKFLGKGESVRYCTELSVFKNGLVLGPGDITFAHSLKEKIRKEDLLFATKKYQEILYSFNTP